jgi:hypothetical protein
MLSFEPATRAILFIATQSQTQIIEAIFSACQAYIELAAVHRRYRLRSQPG